MVLSWLPYGIAIYQDQVRRILEPHQQDEQKEARLLEIGISPTWLEGYSVKCLYVKYPGIPLVYVQVTNMHR
jgi:hypothetical protein